MTRVHPVRRRKWARPRRGMVLILVLVVVVMVSLAGFSFVATMYNEDKATRLRGEELQAEQLVHSGAEAVRTVLAMPSAAGGDQGDLSDNPEWFRGVSVFDDRVNRRRGRFAVVAPRIDAGEIVGPRFGLENESAKLDLGMLPQWDRAQPEAGKNALLALPGMTDAVADAILDWIDPDDTPRAQGAEGEFYETLPTPYAPRNGPAEGLEELLLVRGVTRASLYGWDENRNFQADPAELASQQEAEQMPGAELAERTIPWISLLTCYSAERNANPDGQPRIDLNDNDLSGLQSRLLRTVNPALANFVVAYRQYGPDSGGTAATAAAPTGVDLSVPPRHRIATPLDLINARVRIAAPGERAPRIHSSPLAETNSDFRALLLRLLDQTTTVAQPIVRGRVNINLAPEPVLRAVPGLEPSAVSRILSARESLRSGSDALRRHPVWLLFDRIVDLPKMKALWPYVTCSGQVYRAQIVGFFDGPGPAARAEIVIDATQQPARLAYWKDLRVLGRGYTPEMLGGRTTYDPRDADKGTLGTSKQGAAGRLDLSPD